MRSLTIAIRCFLIFLLIPCVAQPFVAQEPALRGFDDYVTKSMADWKAPGLAIAVVKDDKVVFAKGYGVRTLGSAGPVDERTIFAIGSATKAFTAASLAMLADEGKINWDDPVTKYLKDFQLYDPWVTREITIRDLLCHRSGLGRGDALWSVAGYGRDEIVRRLRYQKPSWSFRSHFGYNNNLYIAAGQIIPAVTGKSWDDFVKERIFAPLGMSSSGTSFANLKNLENVATPHTKTANGVRPLAWRANDNLGPAGSITSSVLDMAQWLRLQLGQGSFGDQKLLSLGAVEEMQKPQMAIPFDVSIALGAPDSHFAAYGFGWFLYDYHGRKLVRHGGNIAGMVSAAGMMPEEKLGIIILSNLDSNELPSALLYRVLDAYLGLPLQDWSGRLLAGLQVFDARNKAAAKRTESARVKDTRPSLPLEQYAGVYRNELYGDAQVTERQGILLFSYSDSFSGELEHWHYDTFRIKWNGAGMPESFVTFTLSADGRVEQMRVSDLDDFKRVPAK